MCVSVETSTLSVQRFNRGAVTAVVFAVLNRVTQHINTYSPVPKRERSLGGGNGGGFFLAFEDFGRMFDHSFPACVFFFFKV